MKKRVQFQTNPDGSLWLSNTFDGSKKTPTKTIVFYPNKSFSFNGLLNGMLEIS